MSEREELQGLYPRVLRVMRFELVLASQGPEPPIPGNVRNVRVWWV